MDAIQITIIRDCKADGTGGTVVDDAVGILGALPDGTPIIDALAAAFADAYGVVELPTGNKITNEAGEEVDEMVPAPMRNISYRMRMFGTEIVAGWASKTAAKTAQEQAAAAVNATLAEVTIIDHKAS